MALFESSHVIDGLEAADQDAVFEALAQKAVELGVTSDASAVVADLRARGISGEFCLEPSSSILSCYSCHKFNSKVELQSSN